MLHILSSCFYHPSENITYNISHNTHSVPILQICPLVSRAQARLILQQSCLPHSDRTVRIGQPIRGPGFPVPGEYADERTSHRPDSGAHVNCLTSLVAFMPDITHTIPTSKPTLDYKVQSPPAITQIPQMLHYPPPPQHKRALTKEQLRGKPLTTSRQTPTLRQLKETS